MLNNLLTFAATRCQDGSFLGLRPWWYYLPDSKFDTGGKFSDDKCNIVNFVILPGGGQRSDIPLVLLAVVDDLLRIAGMVAVGFVIVGAVQYITSQGEPDKTAQAQSTIINALIGLAIAVVAVAFVSFVGFRLGR